MNSEYYVVTTYWVILIVIIAAVATVWLFRMGKASQKTQVIVGLFFAVFIVLMHWGFGGKNLFSPDISGGAFFLIILGWAFLVNMLLFLSGRKVFEQVSQEHIQWVQGLRVFIGGGFLMEGVVGVIPGWFSIMDGFMHIASGFFALVAAIATAKNEVFKNKLLWLANLVGITDIVVIITSISFVVWSDLGPHHNMQYIVFGGGPILLWLHFVSVMKLQKERKERGKTR